jgi:outer membrane protein OmpA-like peptidoglycan-associated protein
MNKLASLVLFLLAATVLTGCQSPNRNPANVRGSDFIGSEFDLTNYGNSSRDDRFAPGGKEYRDRFESVLFAYDSSQIAPSERAKVETVASYLTGNPDANLIVEGHTDERGSNEYNQALSERRAQAIRSYLTNLDIMPERIMTKPLGEENPLDPGHNESAWRLNRRGEFVLYIHQ